jgi:hypothetical protein
MSCEYKRAFSKYLGGCILLVEERSYTLIFVCMRLCLSVCKAERGPGFDNPLSPKLGTRPSPSKVDENDITGQPVRRGHDWFIKR